MNLEQNPVEELKNAFNNLDTKKQGFIEKKDFQKAFVYIGDNFDQNIFM